MAKRAGTSMIPVERIERSILLLRGHNVMLDRDLAALYGVETRQLLQAVKRNLDRFPGDFMFQLSAEEFEDWRSQIVISNPAAKMSVRRRPYAFTEQGVAMLSSVLRSDRAVAVNIEIMRAFVRLRRMLADHEEQVGWALPTATFETVDCQSPRRDPAGRFQRAARPETWGQFSVHRLL